MHKYVLLRSVDSGGTFFSTFDSGEDPTLCDGVVAYEIVGYAKTIAEAQLKLYGKVYTTSRD